MKVLIDECLPGRKLKKALQSHDCYTVADMQWRGIKNGKLLTLAQEEFDVFLTIDGNLPYQQNTTQYDILIVVLRAVSNRLEDILPLLIKTNQAIENYKSGQVIWIES